MDGGFGTSSSVAREVSAAVDDDVGTSISCGLLKVVSDEGLRICECLRDCLDCMKGDVRRIYQMVMVEELVFQVFVR